MLSFSPHKHTVTSATTRSQRLRMGHLKARPLSMSFTSQPIRWTRFEVGCSVALRDCECCESQPHTCPYLEKFLMFFFLLMCISFVIRMLRNNKISCIHNDSFTGLHNVRLLSLYDNQLTTITPGAFDTLQTLSTL